MFFFTCGFSYCKKLPFTEDELKWSAPYAIGDTIMFVGTQSKSIDTLIIKDKTIYNPSNTFIFDTEGCKWWNGDHEFYAGTIVDMLIGHDGGQYDSGFIFEKVCHKKPLIYVLKENTND